MFLGDDVEVRGLPIRPAPAELESVLAGVDRVGLYAEDLAARPELERVLGERGWIRLETIARGGSRAVTYPRSVEVR